MPPLHDQPHGVRDSNPLVSLRAPAVMTATTPRARARAVGGRHNRRRDVPSTLRRRMPATVRGPSTADNVCVCERHTEETRVCTSRCAMGSEPASGTMGGTIWTSQVPEKSPTEASAGPESLTHGKAGISTMPSRRPSFAVDFVSQPSMSRLRLSPRDIVPGCNTAARIATSSTAHDRHRSIRWCRDSGARVVCGL